MDYEARVCSYLTKSTPRFGQVMAVARHPPTYRGFTAAGEVKGLKGVNRQIQVRLQV